MRKLTALMMAVCLFLMGAAALAEGGGNWLQGILEANKAELDVSEDWADEEAVGQKTGRRARQNLALLYIEGEMIEGDAYYDHAGTLDAIDSLIYDENNAALLLVFNTPGGGLYESDELHHAISVYKEETGRPVYAYMKQQCCSGGVYAAMAADTLYASRMTITGSVGVYATTYSEAGLLDKLGIEQEYITTGDNKVSGYPTLTPDQRAIEQAMVNEGFEFFKDVIRRGRGLTDEQMAPFLDGRILTALQARELGLIDEVCYYDEALEAIFATLEPDALLNDITPEFEMGFEGLFGTDILKWFMP